MNILYIPLDERPCNWQYPQHLANLPQQLSLVVPPIHDLGTKKEPANVEQLWAWIHQEIPRCQGAILSVEMLVYGGLLPSRLHHHSLTVLSDRLNRIRQLKLDHPHLTLFASNLIMRTPAYDSSEEEPDYYADWGKAIFRWGWLYDKQQRQGLTDIETQQFDHLRQTLPTDYLNDYRDRRSKNLAVNQGAIALVQDNSIDFLAIPQDDSAPYGFTALDQKQTINQIIEGRLQHRVHLYPGADEVGCTLLARLYQALAQRSDHPPDQASLGSTDMLHAPQGARAPSASYRQPAGTVATKERLKDAYSGINLYILYSSVNSESIIPLYEDRPLGESVKSHVLAAGATIVHDPYQSDVILAVNTPGKVMQEAWDQPRKDITYTTYRNLRVFVDDIQRFLAEGKAVAIADVAFANGGETELVQLLDDAQCWDDILAYAGWNTCCNTLGTAIASAILGLNTLHADVVQRNKIYRLLEDWAYQSIVRMEVVHQYLPTIDASYYDFNGQEVSVLAEIERRIRLVWDQMVQQSFQDQDWGLTTVSPWHRMFEIGVTLDIQTP